MSAGYLRLFFFIADFFQHQKKTDQKEGVINSRP